MITEDYVSFETAKLLKKKGFDSEEVGCHGGFYSERYYHSGYGIITDSGQEVGIVYDDLRNADLEYDEYLRPTIQMAMKWLREIHNMYYEVQLLLGEKAEKYGGLQLGIYQLNSSGAYVWKDWIYADTYTELCENYIKCCLENLI